MCPSIFASFVTPSQQPIMGVFCRAARALDMEQSALSRSILKLECSIGMPIFERSRAGVTMTLAGTAVIRGAKPMVATADKLVAMMREAGQGRAGGLMLIHNSLVSGRSRSYAIKSTATENHCHRKPRQMPGSACGRP